MEVQWTSRAANATWVAFGAGRWSLVIGQGTGDVRRHWSLVTGHRSVGRRYIVIARATCRPWQSVLFHSFGTVEAKGFRYGVDAGVSVAAGVTVAEGFALHRSR